MPIKYLEMTQTKDLGESVVIAVAGIAAELHSVMNVAWGVSLAAKNAKVISAQAGDQALGFQPITNFIDEIAQQSIDGVNTINNVALHLLRLTVTEHRAYDAYTRFNKILGNRDEIAHIDTLKMSIDDVSKRLQQTRLEFRACINKLSTSLDSMRECMLSAHAIASVSRIVTSNIPGYRDSLLVLADNLDNAATYIKSKLAESNVHLEHIAKAWASI